MLGSMARLLFLLAASVISASPLDAKEGPRAPGRDRSELRRDIDRISKEIYPPPESRSAPRRGSFAAGPPVKRR